MLAAGRMLPNCAGAGCWATANSTFPQMKIPVVQTSLPGLARNLEGLQKMQVSGGAGGGGCLPVRGDVLTPLSPPAEEQHRGGAAGRRGPGSVADAELHGTITGGFGGESATGWGSWSCHGCLSRGGWGTGTLLPSHLTVPQAKLGESVQVLSRLVPHLQVLARVLAALPQTPVTG